MSFSDDTGDVDYLLAVRDGERLVSRLPTISHFALILPQIYPFLLKACLVETNLNCLQHYILFLAQNYPHEKLSESVIGISRLIVDRFDVIKKILCPLLQNQEDASAQGSYSVQLQGSLFELFHSAMEAAIHSQTMPQLSSSAESFLVTFPTLSQKAILHATFIQAVFLLLSQSPPHGTAYSDFTYLLDMWVPTQPLHRPEVSAVESKEKVSLPPSEVLHATLLSTNTRVLEAAVQAAKPSLLCKFLEEFGCPVVSMEKVLEFLDEQCSEASVAAEIRHCVLHPASLVRCVEIQMYRGVKSGKSFLTFLRNLGDMAPDEPGTSDGVSEKDYRIGSCSALQRSNSTTIALAESSVEKTKFLERAGHKVKASLKLEEVIAKTAATTCKDVETRADPFENEAAIIKLSSDLSQSVSSAHHLERVIHAVVRRAVNLGMKERCVTLLQRIKTVLTSSAAIAYQCNPELFSRETDKSSETPHSPVLPRLPDVSGLLVDAFELLDPEIISLAPKSAMKFLFESRDTSPAIHHVLLFGQGYLLARLVNNSSWPSLLLAVSLVLDKHNAQEW